MWDTEASIEIDAAPERVYAYLADFRRHSEWSRGLATIEQVGDGPVREGTEFVARETVPVKFTSHSKVSRLDPPRRIEWSAWDEGGTFGFEWAFDISPREGGSVVRQQARAKPKSVMGRMMLALMRKRQIPKENRESLRRLKQALEQKGD